MKRTSILFCLLFAIVANSFTAAKAQINVNDSLALVDLYNSTDGPNWYSHTNWLTAAPVSTWTDVRVDNNRVTGLYLSNNNLSGTLPASIGNLTQLEGLYIEFCELSGAIPAEIGNCTQLDNLWLEVNELSGAIPAEIGNCTKLTVLDLDGNQLSGSIPASIGNLVNLGSLNLQYNQLSGTIPSSLGNLVHLNALTLYNNQLSGTIPVSIGNCTNLGYLYLYNNQLSGAIPVEIGNCTNLSYLQLQNNQLSGAIPASLRRLKYLQVLNLNYNQLSQDQNVHSSTDISKTSGNVSNNFFTFNGLEFIANKYPKIIYTPQANIFIHQNGTTLMVYAGGTLSNNRYEWFMVGSANSSVINGDSTFMPPQSGQYYVKVTNKVAKKLTLYSDTIDFVMSVAKQSNALIAQAMQPASVIKQMLVYPNPAKDLIHVQTTGTASIVVTNSAGKTLLTKTINNTADINVNAFANGTYYIQNKTTGEKEKFIIVH